MQYCWSFGARALALAGCTSGMAGNCENESFRLACIKGLARWGSDLCKVTCVTGVNWLFPCLLICGRIRLVALNII